MIQELTRKALMRFRRVRNFVDRFGWSELLKQQELRFCLLQHATNESALKVFRHVFAHDLP